MTYITKQGDTFDSIAFFVLGDRRYTKDLMEANAKYISTIIFSGGIELTIPDASEDKSTVNQPPWRS